MPYDTVVYPLRRSSCGSVVADGTVSRKCVTRSYTPWVSGRSPVRMDVRDGEHVVTEAYAPVKMVPWRASESMCGVRAAWSP